MSARRRIQIGALLNPEETPVTTPAPSLYPASAAAFSTYVDATRYAYGQRSPSAPAYPLSPVAWEKHHYAHSTHPSPPPAKHSPRPQHHVNPNYNSFDILVDAAATDDYPRAPSRPMSPNFHHDSPGLRALSPPFEDVQHSERASVRLAARSSVRRPANYRESEEEDQLEDDIDVPFIETHQIRANKRRYQADGPDARPPPKKRTPPEAYARHGEVIMTVQVDYGKPSPKSRQTSARAASSKPPKSSDPSSRQNSVRPKRPKKPRQGDEGTPKGSQARVGPAQEYRVFKEIVNEQGELVETLVGELQHSRCMSNRYKSDDFPRCLSCTRRWAGDTCRFQGVRVFYRSSTGDLRDIDFVSEPVGDPPQMLYPLTWNRPMTHEHRQRIKTVATNSLFEILQQERIHLGRPNLVRRARETDCRATCDTCLTSVFAGSWICISCGREACSDCHKKVVEICSDPEKKQRMLDASPFFLICTKRQEHGVEQFRPISRFDPKELEDAIAAMEVLSAPLVPKMGSSPPSIPPELSPPSDRTSSADSLHPSPGSPALPLPHSNAPLSVLGGPSPLLASPETVSTALRPEGPYYNTLPDVVNFDLPYNRVPVFHHSGLPEDIFQSYWKHGIPLVVEGLLELCHIQWTPEYFIREYGTESCLVIECTTDANKRVTVEDFFTKFGEYADRDGCWKLKDWPSSTDFKAVFPKLFDDFMNVVPMPDYSRRDGVLNISSHFPANAVGPDLGPKMYNAYASSQEAGSKGSTKLHMDMADAVNIMHFATTREDGGEGGAVWDIFDAKDSDSIRKFLRNKYRDKNGGDPIHLQLHYLDKESLQDLWDQYQVTSYRIFQRPGDAVFIPAGCAHQVCNMSDCIKVAVDFVSPENIERCENLTREFQAQMWKEDVLQLKTMLWYAWMSCSRQQLT